MIANDCDIIIPWPRGRLTNAANQLGGMIEAGELDTLPDAARATLAELWDELLEIAGSMSVPDRPPLATIKPVHELLVEIADIREKKVPIPTSPAPAGTGDDWAYAHHMVGRFRDCRSEADLDHAFSADQFALARLPHAQFASVLCAYLGRQALLRSDDGR